MILVCFDGSVDAEAAIARAGGLMPGAPATILTIWEPIIDVLGRSSGLAAPSELIANVDDVDQASRDHADTLATQGSVRARAAGLDATPLVRERSGSAATMILSTAVEVNAEVIVLGSRGLTGLKSVLLGSTSHGVLQHADRPVLVVPSAAVARARSRAIPRQRE